MWRTCSPWRCRELFPGTQVTHRPRDRGRVLLRLRARHPPSRPRTCHRIEAKMREIVKRDLPTRREVWARDKAVAHFKGMGESYKAELIESIPSDEDVSIYWHGDWHDLCRGPHFASTGKIGDAFKLTKIAGAYWRGDSKNAQAAAHLRHRLARQQGTGRLSHQARGAGEARPPGKIGKEMELFAFSPDVGAGPAFVAAQRHGDPPGARVPRAAGRAQGRLSPAWHRPNIAKEALYYSFAPPAHTTTKACNAPLDIDGENYYLRPDELPASPSHLRGDAAFLSRAAGAHRRIRPGLSL